MLYDIIQSILKKNGVAFFMKTSTEIGSIMRFCGEEKAIEAVARAGFDAWDFSLFDMIDYDWDTGVMRRGRQATASDGYLAYARHLKQVGLDNGIVCNQSHAPFPSLWPNVKDYLKRALECTAEAGGECCIIHPMNEASVEKNTEMYNDLLPFAKACGVRIATENMWCWNDEENHARSAACSDPSSFNAHLDAVNDMFFVACLDIGHAEMFGLGTNAPQMIRALGSRLFALHIHDNNLHDDCHWLPGYGKIEYDAVLNALKDVDYKGYFTLEANAHLDNCNEFDYQDKITEMSRVARNLADRFDAIKR